MESKIVDKILRYENFINDHLKEDLRKVYMKRDALTSEIVEYIQLKNSIESMSEIVGDERGFKTKMDLGCGFYAQARVSDTSRVLVDVGLGCYVELAPEEALAFVAKRIAMLGVQTEKLRKDGARINGTIKLMLGGLAELQKSLPRAQ